MPIVIFSEDTDVSTSKVISNFPLNTDFIRINDTQEIPFLISIHNNFVLEDELVVWLRRGFFPDFKCNFLEFKKEIEVFRNYFHFLICRLTK